MFSKTPRVLELEEKLTAFMEEHIYPNEARFYREAEDGGRSIRWTRLRI